MSNDPSCCTFTLLKDQNRIVQGDVLNMAVFFWSFSLPSGASLRNFLSVLAVSLGLGISRRQLKQLHFMYIVKNYLSNVTLLYTCILGKSHFLRYNKNRQFLTGLPACTLSLKSLLLGMSAFDKIDGNIHWEKIILHTSDTQKRFFFSISYFEKCFYIHAVSTYCKL